MSQFYQHTRNIATLFFRFYTIIVNPKIDMLYDPKPSEISGYDKEKPESAYLSGILSSFQPTFLVGMYGLWYSNQNFDNTVVGSFNFDSIELYLLIKFLFFFNWRVQM